MISLGDLSRSLVAQARHARIKTDLANLSEEMTTGVKADPASALKGDLTRLTGLQSSLGQMEAFRIANTETRMVTDTLQRVLGDMQELTGQLGTDFLKVNLSTSTAARAALSASAGQVFATLVSGLNTHLAGRSLFAGVATDSAALRGSDEILADIKSAMAGVVTADDVLARLDTWFDAPGGRFESFAYTGADQDLAPVRLNESETIRLGQRADDSLYRDLLKAAVAGQLASDPDLGLSSEAQTVLLDTAGRDLIEAQTRLTSVRADVGAAQERVDKAMQRNASGQSDLRMARNDLIAADPYETATRLELVQSQLEALYAVTARNSRISLVNYLS